MNAIWQTFLQDQNAIKEQGEASQFKESAAELKVSLDDTAVIADLSNLGLIHISGEDAFKFLQGQLTCDLRAVSQQAAQYGSYCSPKGRILANFIIWQGTTDNEYLIQLPAELVASISKRLAMYILRAKVQLSDWTDTLVRIGLAGSKARLLIEELFQITGFPLSTPFAPGVISTEKGSILCREKNRYEIITTPENAIALWPLLTSQAIPAGSMFWDWLEIKAGIPVILPVTQEQFIPQMVNLDAIGGISFQKGCYPGQEIVARTQYLGRLKRRMYLVNIPSFMPVSPGDPLVSDELADQACGMIVNATPSPDGGYDALAVIQVSNAEDSKVLWKTSDGPALRFRSLPYVLPQQH